MPELALIPMDRRIARGILIGEAPEGTRWADGYPTEGSLACATAVIVALRGRPDRSVRRVLHRA